MIFIPRNRQDAQGRVIEPDEGWREEAKAKTDVIIRDGKPDEFDEKFYKKLPLKIALEALFFRKCAYCESYLPEFSFDVEHFRPKGKVKESDTHSGYYWLVYEWTNLYPSCEPCNQNRIDYPTHEDDRQGPSAGKSYQFPVMDESKRAFGPEDSLEDEEPLLLDPCDDNPEEHLRYNLFGEAHARNGSTKGHASIKIYNLGRKRLQDLRKKRLKELLKVLESGGDTSYFVEDEAPYAGFCRYVLTDPKAFGAQV